ncbi:hypothetical protein SLA2020_493250 [Shorea laevis]
MASEIEELCGKLTLSEGEKEGIPIHAGELSAVKEKVERCLVGRVGTEKRINREAFRTLLSRLWNPRGAVVFKEVQNHLWIFEFSDPFDKEKVLKGRPWLFDKNLIVITEFDGFTPPTQIVFSHSPFWVQIHDMPFLCMNREVGRKVGSTLGDVLDVDVAGDGIGWGRCLRVQINIDVTKPLERGRSLHLDGRQVWVSFRYEKLSLFCFRCGRILHGPKGCPQSSARSDDASGIQQWGPWLRAEVSKKSIGASFHGGHVHSTPSGRHHPAAQKNGNGYFHPSVTVNPEPSEQVTAPINDRPPVTPASKTALAGSNANPSSNHGIKLADCADAGGGIKASDSVLLSDSQPTSDSIQNTQPECVTDNLFPSGTAPSHVEKGLPKGYGPNLGGPPSEANSGGIQNFTTSPISFMACDATVQSMPLRASNLGKPGFGLKERGYQAYSANFSSHWQ